jgi:N-acetylmuramoyl-L-alanine amidase
MRRGACTGFLCAALFALGFAGCAPTMVPRTGLPVIVQPSPSFDARRPNYVILHYTTDDTAEQALHTLTDPFRKVSAHYLIGRDGRIYALVDELARAWHAGESYWGGERDINSTSIGIELDNNGDELFGEAQIAVLLALLGDLKERYSLPAANFLGHSDVAPRRKTDPGRLFPWKLLAAQGFGLWCEPPYPGAASGYADEFALLAALGYDISNADAAVAAFRSHFTPDNFNRELTADDRPLLRCLIEQKFGGADY